MTRQRDSVVPFKSIFLTLFLGLLLCISSVTRAQQDQDQQSGKRITVDNLQSYSDFPTKSETTHWYKVMFRGKWIGWSKMKSSKLASIQGDGTRPMEIHRYEYSGQISRHLIRENLTEVIRKEILKQIEKRKEAGGEEISIQRKRMQKTIRNRVKEQMEQLKGQVTEKSFSSTIYLNENSTFRDAKYGLSTPAIEPFTLYIKPRVLGSGKLSIIQPGQVPRDVNVSTDRRIVNVPLAGRVISEDGFSKDTYKFLLLGGTAEQPFMKGKIEIIDEEWESVEVEEIVKKKKEEKGGKEEKKKEETNEKGKTYETRRVEATFSIPGKGTRKEHWWLSRSGVIVKAKSIPKKKEKKSIYLKKTTRENARPHHTFVFARRGRRNPFDPVWPKDRPERTTDTGEKACKEYKSEDILSQAEEIVFKDARKEIKNRMVRIQHQRRLVNEFSKLEEKVLACGDQSDVQSIKRFKKELQKTIKMAAIIVDIARDKRKSARRAFENQQFDRVSSLHQEVETLREKFPPEPPQKAEKQYKSILKQVARLSERAQIQKTFYNNTPTIQGIVSSKRSRKRNLQLGIEVLGERLDASVTVNLPDVKSAAIIEQANVGSRSDVSRTSGETITLNRLGEVLVEEVHTDGVVFNYKGESIKVPLPEVKTTLEGIKAE